MPVGQSAVVWQPQARVPEPKFSHLGPSAAFVQSAAVVQPQTPANEHTGPRGIPVQSAVVLQPRHKPDVVSHTGWKPTPNRPTVLSQSAFVVHAAMHELVSPSLGAQVIPLGQSAFDEQPHFEPVWQTLPPAPLVQSALVVQPHVPPLHTEPLPLAAQSALEAQPHVPNVLDVVLQAPPEGLLAQSARVTQTTHIPLVVLQAGRPKGNVQSALEAHARMHTPLRPANGLHMKPAGQSAFDEQPHIRAEEPGTPSHT